MGGLLLFRMNLLTTLNIKPYIHPALMIARPVKLLLLVTALALASACVYEVDVQQGNKLELTDIEAVEVGMTRSQVRYLLGTPVVSNLFRDNRWDYVYYFRKGRAKQPERRWLIVWFEDELVTKVERDLINQPGIE